MRPGTFVIAALLLVHMLAASAARADDTRQQPEAQIIRDLSHDPGLNCSIAFEHKQYQDAEDYCEQAVVLDEDQATKTPTADYMYHVIRENQAYAAYHMAFSIVELSLASHPSREYALKNYAWASTYTARCSVDAQRALDSPGGVKDVAGRPEARKLKSMCDRFTITLRNLK